jgi:hypothetical protein
VVPIEDINLHFTGDMHALTSSINLIAAVLDNHIFRGNELRIDPTRVIWKRALDMNDRALRSITIGQNEPKGDTRQEEFVITVASELMAILCLALDQEDFINRINNIIVAYNFDGEPVYLKELRISHAVTKLMKGVMIDGVMTKRAKVDVISFDKANNSSLIMLTITEGRNRQVRKMCEAIGYDVKKLKRVSFGGVTLEGLSVGEYRMLKPHEIKKLYSL